MITAETHSGRFQTSKMEFFCENSQQDLVINYFRKRVLS